MPEVNEPYVPGTPCWVDLAVPDQQAALDFYRDLFGWEGEIGPPGSSGYAMCTKLGRPVAGIGQANAAEGAPVAWTTYLATDDAPATLAAVSGANGTPLTDVIDVNTLGQMFIAADPAGGVFGVWGRRDFLGAGLVDEPGAVVWNECDSRDADAAAAFYATVFGVTFTEAEGMGGYQEIRLSGRVVGGLQQMREPHFTEDTPSHWHPYFAVDDADSTVDAAVRGRAEVLAPPNDTPVGRIATLRDPWGAKFSVIVPNRPG